MICALYVQSLFMCHNILVVQFIEPERNIHLDHLNEYISKVILLWLGKTVPKTVYRKMSVRE